MNTKDISLQTNNTAFHSHQLFENNDPQSESVDLNKKFINHPDSTFLIEASGYSMINAFIPPKATLLVDRSISPKNGDIILADLNGRLTVKFFKRNPFKCWLVPANSKYREIEITPDISFTIWGVVTQIITDARQMRSAML